MRPSPAECMSRGRYRNHSWIRSAPDTPHAASAPMMTYIGAGSTMPRRSRCTARPSHSHRRDAEPAVDCARDVLRRLRHDVTVGRLFGWSSTHHGVRIGRQQRVHKAQAAIADRDDVDPAGYRLPGGPTATPARRCRPNICGPVALEHEARQGASAAARRLCGSPRHAGRACRAQARRAASRSRRGPLNPTGLVPQIQAHPRRRDARRNAVSATNARLTELLDGG